MNPAELLSGDDMARGLGGIPGPGQNQGPHLPVLGSVMGTPANMTRPSGGACEHGIRIAAHDGAYQCLTEPIHSKRVRASSWNSSLSTVLPWGIPLFNRALPWHLIPGLFGMVSSLSFRRSAWTGIWHCHVLVVHIKHGGIRQGSTSTIVMRILPSGHEWWELRSGPRQQIVRLASIILSRTR